MNAMQRHLVTLAVIESLILGSAVIRLALGLADFEKPAHLAWFVATAVLASVPVAFYVVRSTVLRAARAEDRPGQQRQALITAVALLVPAALVSAAGPAIAERVMGAR